LIIIGFTDIIISINMTETLNPCSNCENCWLKITLEAIGANYDNGTLTQPEANDMVSRESQKAGLKGCPSPVIKDLRRPLKRINPNFDRGFIRPSVAPTDIRPSQIENRFGLSSYRKRYETRRRPGTPR